MLRTADSVRPGGAIVWNDIDKLDACRATRRAMMAGRPGRRHKRKMADEFDTFNQASSGGRKGWATATDEDDFIWCCVLDSQANGTTWVHDPSCPCLGFMHGDACPSGSACGKWYGVRSIDTDPVPKVGMAVRQQVGKGEEWHPEENKINPRSSALAESYLTFVTEKQKTAGVLVQEAALMLAHILARFLRDMREQAQREVLVS